MTTTNGYKLSNDFLFRHFLTNVCSKFFIKIFHRLLQFFSSNVSSPELHQSSQPLGFTGTQPFFSYFNNIVPFWIFCQRIIGQRDLRVLLTMFQITFLHVTLKGFRQFFFYLNKLRFAKNSNRNYIAFLIVKVPDNPCHF